LKSTADPTINHIDMKIYKIMW